MVVCKFFLQGTCKFGDFCKFDHQLNDNFNNYQNQNSTSILRQSHFSTPQQTKPVTNPSAVDINTLVKSVVNDMTTAEKGGQWLLSCYAPFKEKPAFPGFEDQSFEEVRWGFYEAVKTGTVEQYKQQVQMMLQQAIMKLKSLQSPTPDIINLLKSIYNTPPSSSCGVFGSNNITTSNAYHNAPNTFSPPQPLAFGQQSSSSVFAPANQNIFGNLTQPQNAFVGNANIFSGVNRNVFGGQASNPPFGNSQSQTQGVNKSIFGQANANFGGQTTGSIFGGQQSGLQATTGSIFGSALPSNSPVYGGPQTGQSSVFATQNTSMPYGTQPQQLQTGGTSMFASQAHTPFEQTHTQPFVGQVNSTSFGQTSPQAAPHIFGNSPNAQVGQVFGASTTIKNIPQQNATNIFGGGANQPQNQPFAAATKAIFNQQNDGNSIFSQQYPQNSNSSFSQPAKTTLDAQSHSSNIFGNNQQSSMPSIDRLQKIDEIDEIDESAYSKLEDLTEEEIKWFESDDLDIMNIPEKPPTYEMCFKT
ncbi:hypothetical protein NQ314_012788 [Rhamnusium bicolor]|uniref:Nucleoporin NUP42 n=1 Tax=Rhamnusium bicolor TaxID=1586634 RepID=A0AAV8X9J9_9CUCU|nr:hypothetical protein NQ314_012788 [Rhamnusium bicolor]